jgi:hypothetical protein
MYHVEFESKKRLFQLFRLDYSFEFFKDSKEIEYKMLYFYDFNSIKLSFVLDERI